MTDDRDIKKDVQDLKDTLAQDLAKHAYVGEEVDPAQLETVQKLGQIQEEFDTLQQGLKKPDAPA
jgi:hypothetical protein